jgi:hypothetical protein
LALNGAEILKPSDFSEQVSVVELPVTLLALNTIATQVRSKPDDPSKRMKLKE